jgi:hypothetical protein
MQKYSRYGKRDIPHKSSGQLKQAMDKYVFRVEENPGYAEKMTHCVCSAVPTVCQADGSELCIVSLQMGNVN